MTNSGDGNPAMPDALEVAARQDAYFASNGKLIGPLHGVAFSIKDQYDTFDMRTTGRRTMPPLSSACARRVRLSSPRRTSAKWERPTRGVPSVVRSVILTIRLAALAPRAEAPEPQSPQT